MDAVLIDGTPPVVKVSGEVDFTNVEKLRDSIDGALKPGPKGLVIDLAETTYIDSAGIAAVIAAYQRIRRTQGHIALVIENESVRKIIDLVRLDLLPGFTIHNDLDAARQAAVSG